MESSFWHQMWEDGELGFHEGQPNLMLTSCFHKLDLPVGARVFLPLCGKTRDIAWLLDLGYRVVGAELSELAIRQLFSELGLEPEIKEIAGFRHFSSGNLDVFVGDVFGITSTLLGAVDATYDRAAIVALPKEMRKKYTAHLMTLTGNGPQLVITYEYDQDLLPGPPFSVTELEIREHYNACYQICALASASVEGGLKGVADAVCKAWLLNKVE